MNNQQPIDFNSSDSGKSLRRINKYLWGLTITDYFFKAGSYLLVVSIILIIIGRITHISFLSLSPWLIIVPLAGLALGFIAGILYKPSLMQTAVVIDAKSGLDNYFSTVLECTAKESPNEMEQLLTDNAKRNGGDLLERFSFAYNWRYPLLFMILSGVMLVIWITPMAHSQSPDRAGQNNAMISPQTPDILTITQNIAEIKNNQENTPEINEMIQQIESVINNIRNNSQSTVVILEKIDAFISELSGIKIPLQESDKLRALLTQLKSLVADKVSSVSVSGAGPKETGTVSQTSQQQGSAPANLSAEKYSNEKVDFNTEQVIKSREEAINNPYLPDKYKEIIKNYFSKE